MRSLRWCRRNRRPAFALRHAPSARLQRCADVGCERDAGYERNAASRNGQSDRRVHDALRHDATAREPASRLRRTTPNTKPVPELEARDEVSGETQATETWIILCSTPAPVAFPRSERGGRF